MKIALVNLCSISNIANWASYQDDISFLKSTNIGFFDYASGRSTKSELLKGFYEALNNEEVSVIWFVSGGTALIQYLPELDWSLIKSSGKKFIGLSDFTHFALLASNVGVTCYYGLALKKVTKYYSIEQRERISNFLQHVITNKDSDLVYIENKKITGGHLSTAQYIISNYNIGLHDKVLFLEYHYIPGESWEEFEYYIHQLCLSLKIRGDMPAEILLGHSVLFKEDGSEIEVNLINDFCKKIILSYFDLHIKEIDHFNSIIKFD